MKTRLLQKCIALFICMASSSITYTAMAQLAGGTVYPINGTENPPASFASLRTAATYLNNNGVTGTGQAILEFQTGYLATADNTPGTAITINPITGTSTTLGVTIRPAAGFTTSISFGLVGDAVLLLSGTQYLTIDGRQGGTGTTIGLTIQNTSTSATAQTAAVKLVNDARFNTLEYLNLNSASTNSANTAGTVIFGTSTGTVGNSNNTISYCNLGPALPATNTANHILALGTAGRPNSANTISNCNISNFIYKGILLNGTGVGDGWTFDGNSFYSTVTGTGIQTGLSILGGNTNNHSIINNSFGGQAANCGGSPFASSGFYALELAVGVGTATSVQNNTVANFAINSNFVGTLFAGILLTRGNVSIGNITGNTFGSQIATGSITITTTSTAASLILGCGIYVQGGAVGTVNVQNNTIGGYTLNPTGVSSTSFIFRGLDNESTTLTSAVVANNTVGGTVANSIQNTGTGRTVYLQGLFSYGTISLTGNTIRNITALGTTTAPSYATAIGFYPTATGVSFTCSANTISGLTATGTGSGTVIGILSSVNAANVVASIAISNNSVSALSSTVNGSVYGIDNINNSNANTAVNGSITANTVTNLSNANTGTGSSVYGIYSSSPTTTSLSIATNTISNLSTASTTPNNSSTAALVGISVPLTATVSITQNTISNLACTGAAVTHVVGIGVLGGATIARNRVYNLTNANATAGGTVKGIVLRAAGNYTVANNQLALGAAITNNVAVYGIENNSASTRADIYYNSIYIAGTATGSGASTGIFRNGAAVNTIINARDNIISNTRTGGTGLNTCFINSSTTPATGWDNAGGNNNYNLLVIPVGATTVGVWNSSNLDFATWQSTTGTEVNSISVSGNTTGTSTASNVNMDNLFTDPSTGNLNVLDPTSIEASLISSKGTPIATQPGDYGATSVRNTTSGTTDIGSDEIDQPALTWTGSTSTDWATASNWSPNTVPANGSIVTIPSGTTFAPTNNGTVYLDALTMAAGATLTNNASLNVWGTLSNNGTVAGSSPLMLSGIAPQTISGIGTMENLAINNTGTTTISSGSSHVLNITGTLTSMAGTLMTNGNLLLKSSATATARIAAITGAISGNITQERYIPAKSSRTWSLVASPFSQTISSSWQQQIHITGAGTGGTVCPSLTAHTNGFDATLSNAASMFVYDGLKAVNTRWTPITGTTAVSLAPGTGYRINIRGPRSTGCSLLDGTPSGLAPAAVTLSSTGSLSAANGNMGTFTVTYNNNGDASAANDNYLLIGNPYPSEISFSQLRADNSTRINNNYALFAPGNTVGNYAYWNGTTWTGGNTGLSNATGNIIANGQAFFVQGSTAGADIALNFNESQKTSTANNGNFRQQQNPDHVRIGYFLNNGDKADEIMLQFAQQGTVSALNAEDIISMNNGTQTLKSVKGERMMAINTRNINFTVDTVQLNVASSSNGSFKLSFYGFDEFVAGSHAKIYLLDKYTGTTQLMNDVKDYPFTVNTTDAASFGKERFAVVFSKPKPVTIIPMVLDIKAYPNPVTNELKVQLAAGNYTLKLMDAMGRVLVQQTASSNASINTSKLAAGTYLLEITNEKGEKSIEKIVKQ